MIWLISIAIALMLLEFVLPGGVAFAFGLSLAILVFADYLGFHFSLIDSFLIGCSISLVWICIVMISSKYIFKSLEEKKDMQGHFEWLESVKVLEKIEAGHSRGRVFFQGTSWNATCQKGSFAKGDKVQIIQKENLTFVVREIE
jgi:membrane protein implicated in regulation of membrane protease activity